VIKNWEEGIVLGIKPSTYARQKSIALEPVYVVMLTLSRGWFVGGEMKLLIENEIVIPAANCALAIFVTETSEPEFGPVHCIAKFIFYVTQ